MNIYDLIDMVAAIASTGCLAYAIYCGRKGAPAYQVEKAVAYYLLGLAARIICLGADILNPRTGWTAIAVDLILVAIFTALSWLAAKRAARLDGEIR